MAVLTNRAWRYHIDVALNRYYRKPRLNRKATLNEKPGPRYLEQSLLICNEDGAFFYLVTLSYRLTFPYIASRNDRSSLGPSSEIWKCGAFNYNDTLGGKCCGS